ncbi:PAS domain S-box protein [Methanobacterium alkalithermotolerans]|uniref:PAS domain S-box protein n=1 Tax=Methanobacterium alkalithermotolerans TaxID=2731220 RepID=A0A8T8K433_9EURY|nr:PAS domain S-box protein [Methanobacterium alkalithermotolerans]QUH22652.1 PAS domain S-box protein [Methanobacterium alkalithermotolerans]
MKKNPSIKATSKKTMVKKDYAANDNNKSNRNNTINNNSIHSSSINLQTELDLKEEILNQVTDSIFLHDFQGNFIYFNDTAWKSRGYSKKELEKLNLRDFDVPEYALEIKSRMDELKKKGQLLFESAHQHKNGTIIPVEVNARVVEFKGKKLILSVARDINDRKMIQSEIARSRELSQIINTLPDYLTIIDFEGNIELTNPYLQENLGWGPEVQGKNIRILLEKEFPLKKLKILLNQGYLHQEEVNLKHKNGKTIPAILNAALVPDAEGNPLNIIAIARDVSQLKEVELELEKSRIFLEKIIDSLRDGFSVLTKDGEHVMVNPALCQMTGYRREELLGQVPPHPYWGDNVATQKILNEVICGDMDDFELVFKKKDGSLFPVIVSPSSLKSPEGETYYFATVKDISSLKQIEDDLKKSLQEKEVLMKEIHHRVKNNLQIISSLLSLQTDYIENKTDLAIFKDSQCRAKSMALIHEKLYQSGLLKSINIKDYISALVNELIGTYSGEGKIINLEMDVDDILMDVDTAIPLGLILNEIITNSLKHAFVEKEGEIKVHLKSSDNEIQVEVADNGVGIGEDIDWRNTDSLGLQLVNNLCRQIDGEIELDNTRGTCFKIRFPGKD